MPSPLSVEYGFRPHVPSPAGDFDCGEYFDFAAYERDRGDGVLHHHHPRSSEGSIHTPALTADSTTTPPSEHFEGLGGHAAGHLNSLSDVLGFDDEWTYPSSDPGHGAIPRDFSLMLNSNFPSSSSSSSSYSSSPPSYSSSSSHPPSSASSPPSSYPPSPPSFPQDARRGRSETSSSSGSSKGSKKRHLHRPEQTAEVRENGACIRCRIRRVRVSCAPPPPIVTSTANFFLHPCFLFSLFLGSPFWVPFLLFGVPFPIPTPPDSPFAHQCSNFPGGDLAMPCTETKCRH